MQSKTYTIENIKCAGCANSVTSLLSAIPGVEEVTVNLAENTTLIRYQEAQVNESQFQAALADTNFNIHL